jgi:Ser/Thr protein kinase RdoA (MazF antagonist)
VLPNVELTRRLDGLAQVIERYDLIGLRPGLDWLLAHEPLPVASPRILHLDFHPMNLMAAPGRPLVVLDWSEADVGDPHADVATTLMILKCLSAEESTLYDRLLVGVGRVLFRRWYLRAYRRRRPLDRDKLAYYRAWAAFGRLCRYGLWLHEGPGATGSKPSSLRHLSPGHVRTLEDYFRRWSGVAVRLAGVPAAERVPALSPR